MHATDYQHLALRTAKPLPIKEAFRHAAMGLSSDFGEVTTLIKKITVYSAKITDVDKKSGQTLHQLMVKELGDVTWFIAYAANLLKKDLVYITFWHIYDIDYMASRHMDEDADYWALMGAKAAGDFNGLIASPIDPMTMPEMLSGYLAKLYTCVVQIAHVYNIDIGVVFQENIDKLRERYPDGYSDQAAMARADKNKA